MMDNSENEEQLGITDHDEEISVGQTIAVKVFNRYFISLWSNFMQFFFNSSSRLTRT